MPILAAIRSSLGALLYPLFLGLCSLTAIIGNLLFNSRTVDNRMIRFWGRASCWMFGVHIHVEGLENIPAGGCLFLFNHTSFFDIFAMAAKLEGVRFGAKIELFRIPFFGAAMRRLGMLPIARDRREEVFKLYKASEIRIKNGERFALAPEGTRQYVEKLGPFKAGPFVFAINAKAPIVPVVILNASQILPKNRLIPNWGVWSKTIRMIVLPAIDTTHFSTEARPQLQEQVKQNMQSYFVNN